MQGVTHLDSNWRWLMKKSTFFSALLVAVTGLSVVFAWRTNQLNSRRAAELLAQQAAWQQERAQLESALNEARAAARTLPVAPAHATPAESLQSFKLTPAQILANLRAYMATSGTRGARRVIHDLEELIDARFSALPPIREFWRRNEDIDFAPSLVGKAAKGTVANDFLLPPSLRFGL